MTVRHRKKLIEVALPLAWKQRGMGGARLTVSDNENGNSAALAQ